MGGESRLRVVDPKGHPHSSTLESAASRWVIHDHEAVEPPTEGRVATTVSARKRHYLHVRIVVDAAFRSYAVIKVALRPQLASSGLGRSWEVRLRETGLRDRADPSSKSEPMVQAHRTSHCRHSPHLLTASTAA